MAEVKVEIENDRIIIFKDGREKVILVTIPLSEKEAFFLFSMEKDKRNAMLEIILKAYKRGCEEAQ